METNIEKYECDWCGLTIKYNPLIHSARPDIHMMDLDKNWDECECWVFYKQNKNG